MKERERDEGERKWQKEIFHQLAIDKAVPGPISVSYMCGRDPAAGLSPATS